MAERLRKMHQEDVRAKIQTSQLVNRLSDHAFGKIELEPSQIKAIEVLIRKTLPDLANIQLSGDENNPVRWEETRRTVVDPRNTDS